MKKILSGFLGGLIMVMSLLLSPSLASAATIDFTNVNVINAKVGQYYTGSITFSYNGSYALNVTFANLPPGITTGSSSNPAQIIGLLANNNGTATAHLSGTPTLAGTWDVIMNVDDQYGTTAGVAANIVVAAAQTPAYYGYPPKNIVSNGTVYLANGINRQPYTSAAAFLSYSFNSWTNLTPASYSDLLLPLTTYTPNGSSTPTTLFVQPRNGSLINDHGTVYIITNGLRAGFSSEQTFKGLGYSFNNVIVGDTSFLVTLAPINSSLQAHPSGTVVNQDGTLFFIQANGSKLGIPNMDIFNSWGFKLSEVVQANYYDRQINASNNLQMRQTNQFSL